MSFGQCLHVQSMVLGVSEVDEEVGVSIIGQKVPTPPPASQLGLPLHTCPVCEGGSAAAGGNITSKELDKRMNDRLSSQAEEW